MEIKKCSNCGKEDFDYMMHYYNTGRPQWLCDKCYKMGEKHVRHIEAEKDTRILKKYKWSEKWRKK